MLRGYFETIPLDLEEAAMVDGCTRIGALIRILLPLSAPGAAAVIIYSFIWSWQEYVFASTLISSDAKRTISIGISMVFGEHIIEVNQLMAICVLASLPIIGIFLSLQKFFIQGLTGGAVKG